MCITDWLSEMDGLFDSMMVGLYDTVGLEVGRYNGSLLLEGWLL